MVGGQRRAWASAGFCLGSATTSAVARDGRFGARLFQAVGQHGLGMPCRPKIGEHVLESFVICVQSHEKFTYVRPRFDAMTLCARQDRVQHCRSRAGVLTPEK